MEGEREVEWTHMIEERKGGETERGIEGGRM